jgi:hypothetical protein
LLDACAMREEESHRRANLRMKRIGVVIAYQIQLYGWYEIAVQSATCRFVIVLVTIKRAKQLELSELISRARVLSSRRNGCANPAPPGTSSDVGGSALQGGAS